MVRKITYMGAKTPEGSAMKFGMLIDVNGFVTHAIILSMLVKGF